MSLKGMLAALALSTVLTGGATVIANAAGDEIVIGAPVSLTGPFAGDGKEQEWAYKQAVADINKAGGIGGKTIKLIVEDSEYKTQEALTAQIAGVIQDVLNPRGVAVMIEAEHMCMAMRGIRKPGATTTTSAVRGGFKNNAASRAEVLSFIRT